MNWTVVVYFVPMTFVMTWWFVSARKWFKGPKVNVTHRMLGDGDNVIEGEGKDVSGDSSSDAPVEGKAVPQTDTKAALE